MEKLLKIYRLAMSGIGGEREAARALLEKHLKKRGVTLAELEAAAGEGENSLRVVWFPLPVGLPGWEDVLCNLVFSFNLRAARKGLMIHHRKHSTIQKGRLRTQVDIGLEVESAEASLLAVFFTPCLQAYRKSCRNMRARQKREREQLASAFITENDLYSTIPTDYDAEADTTAAAEPLAVNWADLETFDHDHGAQQLLLGS